MATDQQDLVMVGVVAEPPTTQKVGADDSIKTRFKLQGRDGLHSYSMWGSDFFEQVKQGDTVTVRYYESAGRQGSAPFRNVNSFEKGASENDSGPSAVPPVESATEPAERPPAPVTASPGTMLADHPAKRESIERQVALGHALNWANTVGGGVSDKKAIIGMAEEFYQWISQKGYTGSHVRFCGQHQLFYDGTSAKGNKYHMQEGQYCVEGREELISLPGGDT